MKHLLEPLLSWKIIPLIVFIILAVFLWRGLNLQPNELPSVKVGKKLPQFRLPLVIESNTEIKKKYLSSNEFKNSVTLLNVWSSWCMACTQEQAFLLKLSQSGIKIYGLNYKDNIDSALKWLREWGNPYVLSGNDYDGTVGINLGVYGSPETFLIDKHGVIRFRYPGILNEFVWNKEFLPLLKLIEQE
jgi:cytochrome c biogenesis protein CcmG/thiol:disulfide interchange protein DsbE